MRPRTLPNFGDPNDPVARFFKIARDTIGPATTRLTDRPEAAPLSRTEICAALTGALLRSLALVLVGGDTDPSTVHDLLKQECEKVKKQMAERGIGRATH